MTFLSDNLSLSPEKPLFASVLANTMLSVVPGMSGAGRPRKRPSSPRSSMQNWCSGER